MEVYLRDHRKMFKEEYKDSIRKVIQDTLTHSEIHTLTMYLFDGAGSNVKSGNSRELNILAHHSIMPLWDDAEQTIIERDGVNLAQYITHKRGNEWRTNQLIIFDNLFEEFNEENRTDFEYIIKMLDAIFYQQLLDYSWKSTSKKDELTRNFTEAIRVQQSRYLEEDKQNLETAERKLREYMNYIKSYSDKRIRLQSNIESAQTRIAGVGERLLKDLDNIVANPKVKELFIRDGKFSIETNPIYAYHDVTGDRYYIGNMRIELNPEHTSVKFFGDNPRKSYWTTHDPHPHVSGNTNEACLGNISGTIAELCSQMEIYALSMVCIDFLESVNTSDTAGKNIVNWDRVDDEGNVIEHSHDQDYDWYCDRCVEGHDDNETSYQVYESYTGDAEGNGDWGTESYVCEDCIHEYYTFHEILDAYIRDGECDIDEDDDEEEEDNEF
jgi:hypothetical protein